MKKILKLQVEKLGWNAMERFFDKFAIDEIEYDYDFDEEYDYYEVPIRFQDEPAALMLLDKFSSFGIDVKVL